MISCTQYRLDLPLFVLFGGYFHQLNGLLKSGCSAGGRSRFLSVTQQINVLFLRDWGVNATDFMSLSSHHLSEVYMKGINIVN